MSVSEEREADRTCYWVGTGDWIKKPREYIVFCLYIPRLKLQVNTIDDHRIERAHLKESELTRCLFHPVQAGGLFHRKISRHSQITQVVDAIAFSVDYWKLMLIHITGGLKNLHRHKRFGGIEGVEPSGWYI